VEPVEMTLLDIDRLLDATTPADPSIPVRRIRAWRDDLAHAAVLLSYARHVLSVDLGILESARQGGRDLQALVDELPRQLASASIGGGWSLSPDATASMDSARRAVAGEADGLMAAHSQLAGLDVGSPEEVEHVSDELRVQLEMVNERHERVEVRLREVKALLVQRYKDGAADADDWLR
jgi:hypothetical protein